MKKEDITNLLDNLVGNIEEENIELYKKVLEKGIGDDIKTPEDFFFAILYPFDQFLDALIHNQFSKDYRVAFLLKHSHFIEMNFEKLFIKYEGHGSCADKSRTIISSLFTFLLTGEKINFDYDAKYTFHLPKKIFKKHEDIEEFFEGLYALYYGQPEKYMKALAKTIQGIKPKRK